MSAGKQIRYQRIKAECGARKYHPEEINDEPNSAPSNRIQALKNDYRKVAMGKTVSEAIGIQTIRKQCPHFNSWLNKLENFTV
jgi:hypothetical protein